MPSSNSAPTARPALTISSLVVAALLLGGCNVVGRTLDSERTMMGVGAAVGTVAGGVPFGTIGGAISGSSVHYAIYGERSSTNNNRSCRELRGCVFSGN